MKQPALVLVFLGLFVQHGAECADVCNPSTGESSVPDCNCKFHSVDYAVNNFISPILSNLTTKSFFRYFKVDLGSPCPFWPTVGQCVMEGCSVCTCEENEIPRPWLESDGKKSKQGAEYGWISASSSVFGFEGLGQDDSLGQISVAEGESRDMRLDDMYGDSAKGRNDNSNGNGVSFGTDVTGGALGDHDDNSDDDWTVLNESPNKRASYNLPAFASSYGYGALFEPVETAEQVVSDASYVNLLENPERFTGYSGPSAQRVWRSIQEENCFGDLSDVCLEKRIFYRLMSGMQSSISTHIARNYLLSNGSWGTNVPLFWRAVGDHPDRLNNMYFSFLFLLRAVVRAQDTIRNYPYNTGNTAEDLAVVELLDKFLASSNVRQYNSKYTEHDSSVGIGSGGGHISPAESLKGLLRGDIEENAMKAVEECRYGFNESDLFQVSATLEGPQYWNRLQEKQELRDEFMAKFRNISRIMDCVTCDKCRVWGKLQILGIGTAIKILLHPVDRAEVDTRMSGTSHTESGVGSVSSKSNAGTDHVDADSCAVSTGGKRSGRISLNRQEIIALLNTLNQFANSLKFAADAAKQALDAETEKKTTGEEAVEPKSDVAASLANTVVNSDSKQSPSQPPLPAAGEAPASATISVTETETSSRNSWFVVVGQFGGYVAPLLLLISVCWRADARARAERGK